MKKNKEFSEEGEKLKSEIKGLQQKLLVSGKSIDTISAGNIDALVVTNKKELKVYTEKTADKTYRILIEKMHEGAVTLNEGGTILYCNSSFANMVNQPLQKVIGAFFKKFIDASSKDHFEDMLTQSRENVVNEEVYIYTSDGKALPVLMSLNAFTVDDTFVLSIILTDLTIQNKNREELKWRAMELVQKNIELNSVNKKLQEKAHQLQLQDKKLIAINTELQLLNQSLEKRVFERTSELENLNHELKDLNLSKDKFLSVISHDLRNPFTALLISSQALSDDTENNIFDGIRPYIEIVNRTSHNIFRQLEELVEWAQMQREKTALNPVKIHLIHGVDQSWELIRENAIQKSIVFENQVPYDIYINADPLMFRSILQNLVTNAIKYTQQGGSITVSAERIDKMVEICIRDSGVGMDADVSKSLFTNSHFASVSGTDNEKGTGLGLMLVKDFVAKHGGTIRVESEVGKGTYIFFTMPKY